MTKLTNLDPISKKEIKQKIKKHKLTYKTNIGLSKNMKFGIEIEAISKNFIDIMKRKSSMLYYEYPEDKPSNIYDFNSWHVTSDESIEMIGGEVVSPILTDGKESWQEIKKILRYIKRHVEDVKINDLCSSHIHFDSNILNNNPENLFSLMVLLAETEPILTRFYSGEFINLRKGADKYAKPFTDFFLNSPIDKSTYYSTLNSFYYPERVGIDYKQFAFEFSRLYLHLEDSRTINTIENRLPNGSLEPIIIQNNIMLMGMLMMHAVSGNYDYEKGLYNIKSFDRNISEIDDDKAFYVADMLPTINHKLDFLKQYYKDGTTSNNRTLIKSKKFF